MSSRHIIFNWKIKKFPIGESEVAPIGSEKAYLWSIHAWETGNYGFPSIYWIILFLSFFHTYIIKFNNFSFGDSWLLHTQRIEIWRKVVPGWFQCQEFKKKKKCQNVHTGPFSEQKWWFATFKQQQKNQFLWRSSTQAKSTLLFKWMMNFHPVFFYFILRFGCFARTCRVFKLLRFFVCSQQKWVFFFLTWFRL